MDNLSKKIKFNLRDQKFDALNQKKLMIVSLNSIQFGINIKFIQELKDLEKIRQLPHFPSYFMGIYNLRNEITTVLDLYNLIFHRPNPIRLVKENPLFKSLFINTAEESFAVMVNDIEDIIPISVDIDQKYPIETISNRISLISSDFPVKYIYNIYIINNKPIIELNFYKLIEDYFPIYDNYLIKEDYAQTPSGLKELISNQELEDEKTNEKEPIQIHEKTLPEFDFPELTESTEEKILSLNNEQIDALREISSIATRKIIMALSRLLVPNSKIEIELTNIGVENLGDFYNRQPKKDETYVAIRAQLSQDFHGVVYLLISSDGLHSILEKIALIEKLPEQLSDIDILDKDVISSIQEIGNIIISHYCSGLSDFLKLRLYHQAPEIAIGEYTALIDNEIADLMMNTDQGIITETEFILNNKSIDGNLLFIPYTESIPKFMEFLEVDRILELLDKESEKERNPQISNQIKQSKKSKKSEKSVKETKKTKKTSKKKKEIPPKTSSEPIFTIEKRIEAPTSDSKLPVSFDIKTASKSDLSTAIMNLVIPQNQMTIDETILNQLGVKIKDLDAFRELGNIGAGHAGNILSDILHEKVYLEIPPANVMTIDEMIENFGNLKNKKMFNLLLQPTGDFESYIGLSYTPTDIKNLMNIYLKNGFKKTIRKLTDLTIKERDLIQNLLEKLSIEYFNAICNFLFIIPTETNPKFYFRSPKALLNKLKDLSNLNEKMVVVETAIHVESQLSMRGQFYLLVKHNNLQKILKIIKNILE
ncbi:MAG: chemotaxis protein CheW [Promethearchaeota archaeon]